MARKYNKLGLPTTCHRIRHIPPVEISYITGFASKTDGIATAIALSAVIDQNGNKTVRTCKSKHGIGMQLVEIPLGVVVDDDKRRLRRDFEILSKTI